ncbi:MAG: hypothetical protein AAB488_01630 [Patescibacteria group bacterium]
MDTTCPTNCHHYTHYTSWKIYNKVLEWTMVASFSVAIIHTCGNTMRFFGN